MADIKLVNNAVSEDCPDYLIVKHGNTNKKRRLIGEERRHYVDKAWGISKECPTYFKYKETLINGASYENPFMNKKICEQNEKKMKTFDLNPAFQVSKFPNKDQVMSEKSAVYHMWQKRRHKPRQFKKRQGLLQHFTDKNFHYIKYMSMLAREERADTLERETKNPVAPTHRKKMFVNTQLRTLVPVAFMDNSGGTGMRIQQKDIDVTPRTKKPALHNFRNLSVARVNRKKYKEMEEENPDPSGRLLLTDRPRLFPDYKDPKLFPRFSFKKKPKTIIKPYLHNMSYKDLMQWRKQNYCKVYNNMTTKITKQNMTRQLNNKNRRLLKKVTKLGQPNFNRSQSISDTKRMRNMVNQQKLTELKTELDFILNRKKQIEEMKAAKKAKKNQ